MSSTPHITQRPIYIPRLALYKKYTASRRVRVINNDLKNEEKKNYSRRKVCMFVLIFRPIYNIIPQIHTSWGILVFQGLPLKVIGQCQLIWHPFHTIRWYNLVACLLIKVIKKSFLIYGYTIHTYTLCNFMCVKKSCVLISIRRLLWPHSTCRRHHCHTVGFSLIDKRGIWAQVQLEYNYICLLPQLMRVSATATVSL